MSKPLTPPECDLTDFGSMFFDVRRLLTSETWIEAAETPRLGHALMCLWMESWHQRPAASLPNNEPVLARLAMCDLRTWKRIREKVMAGWVLCDDGRWYHPVVAEKALEAWGRKASYRDRTAAARAAKEAKKGDVTTPVTDSVTGADKDPLTRLKGRGRGRVKDSETDVSGENAPIDPEKKAWDDAVSLLTSAGGLAPGGARGFIGKLKADFGIDAKDLLPAIGQAIANQTQDPAGYLRKAAEGIGKRKGGGAPVPPDGAAPASADDWTRRLGLFRESGYWPGSWGPRPGEPQCQCPADLLEAS